MSSTAKQRLRRVVGVAASALLLVLLAAAVYRMYAPGDLSERLARAGRRWTPFTTASTWRFLWKGIVRTASLAGVSLALSLVISVALALVRLAGWRSAAPPRLPLRALRSLVGLVVEIVRSIPLLLLIIYTFIGMPRLGVNLSPFVAGVVALTLYTSCVLSEIVRAGILSLERGQFEAAEALGLRYTQRMRFIVLPQALRRMVPAIVSQLVTLIKDTSLVSLITVVELMRSGQILLQARFNPIETYIVVAAIYFGVNMALSEVARRLEVQPSAARRVPAVSGVDTAA